MLASRTLLIGTLLALLTLVSTILAHAASPQSYTLKASDLARGFAQKQAQVTSNASVAKKSGIAKVQFDQHGRISGYRVNLVNQATGSAVVSQASTFRNASGAHWAYTVRLQYDAKNGQKQVGAPKIGAESRGSFDQSRSGKDTVIAYSVEFRQGSLENTVSVLGAPGKVSLNQAVKLARIQAAREPAS